MGCLQGLIGFRAACLAAPGTTDEVYIDDLPGINATSLAGMSDDLQKLNFLDEFRAIERRSELKMERDLVAGIRPYKFASEVRVFEQPDTNSARAAQRVPFGVYEGLKIEIAYSDYATLKLPTLQVYSSTMRDASWVVINNYTKQVIGSGIVSLNIGYNIVPVAISAQVVARRVDITFLITTDGTAPNVYYNLSDAGYRSCDECGPYDYGVSVRPVSSEDATGNDLRYVGSAFGIVASPTLVCSPRGLVCQLLPNLTYIWLNLLASEIWIQAQISTRSNIYTLKGPEAFEAQRQRHLDEYNAGMKELLSSIKVQPDECLCCDERVGFTFTP